MNFKEFKSLNTKLNFDRKKHNTMTEHMNWQWGIKRKPISMTNTFFQVSGYNKSLIL
jgi:hypothetical protein